MYNRLDLKDCSILCVSMYNLIFQIGDVAYDGDEENTTEGSMTSLSSCSTMSMSSLQADAYKAYEFDEPDCMDISPLVEKKASKKSTKVKAPAKSTKTKTATKKKADVPAKTSATTASSNKSVKTKSTPKSNKLPVTPQTPLNEDSFTKLNVRRSKRKSPLSPIPLNIDSSLSASPSPVVRKTVSFTSLSPITSLYQSPSVSNQNQTTDFSRTPVVALNRLDLSGVHGYDSFQRQLRKRKSDSKAPAPTTEPKNKVLKSTKPKSSGEKSVNKIKNISANDSGLFSPAPVSRTRKGRAPHPSVTDTSTPSNEGSKKRKVQDTPISETSCFGFSGMKTPLPSLSMSPVRNPITPMSDYASMDSTSILYEEIPRKDALEMFSHDDDAGRYSFDSVIEM